MTQPPFFCLSPLIVKKEVNVCVQLLQACYGMLHVMDTHSHCRIYGATVVMSHPHFSVARLSVCLLIARSHETVIKINHRRQSHYFVCLLPHIKLINYEKEGEYPCPGFVTASDMLCYAACYGHRKQFYDCESLAIYRLGDLSVITCVTLRITIYSNKS